MAAARGEWTTRRTRRRPPTRPGGMGGGKGLEPGPRGFRALYGPRPPRRPMCRRPKTEWARHASEKKNTYFSRARLGDAGAPHPRNVAAPVEVRGGGSARRNRAARA